MATCDRLAVMSETSTFFVPATPVPVAAQIGCVLRHDDEMAYANVDDTVAPRAHVGLARLIRLNRMHDEVLQVGREP